MTAMDFANAIVALPAEEQNACFEALKGVLSEKDYNTTVQFIALHGMFTNPAKYYAMREAVKEMIVAEFFANN